MPVNKVKLREETFEAIRLAADVESAVFILRDAYKIGNVSYHQAQAVAGKITFDSPYVKTTYPPEWVGHYVVKRYMNIDPILKEGLQRILPFHWSDDDPPEEAMDLFEDFQTHGLSPHGYSIPVTDKVGRRALVSLVSSNDQNNWLSIVETYKDDWLEISQILHKRAIVELFGEADPAPVLASRELDVLYWTAHGKTYKEIAIILVLSDATVRSYLRSVRHKLDCYNLTQAVTKAIQLRLINP